MTNKHSFYKYQNNKYRYQQNRYFLVKSLNLKKTILGSAVHDHG